ASCGAGSECASTFCQQGVCCQTACTGTCRSCNVPGSAGTCSAIPAGQPALTGQCTAAATSTCGADGTRDGAGGCHLYAGGTVCVGPSCDPTTSTLTPARTCDGSGSCRTVTAAACPGALKCLDAAQCRGTCGADADCVSPNVCIGGVCARKPT